jgi:beta-galactosidase GanA
MSEDASLPHLRRGGRAAAQLIVDGKPFLVLGGELGNSSASDPDEFPEMFARLRRMHLNTVLTPVYWDRVEPREGDFDFSLVRAAIEAARAADGLRLVLLWFGTWKNSMSCYAPGWVKRDAGRFPRVRLRSGEATEIVSPACAAARDADARAFAALMRWLREFDGERHTVLMVQVENEVGMIPEPRDHSPGSEAAYREAVPAALLSRLTAGELGPEVTALWRRAGGRDAGTWPEVFGEEPEGEEVFSAWQFATFVEAVAAAGREEYPLPLFANAALIRPGYRPGQYPSAGPLPHLMEVWQTGAPSLDMLSPDIYFPNFGEWAGRYVRGGNPLFVPEMAASARVGGNALCAIGRHGAMGVAPFAVETTDQYPQIADCYRLLAGLAPHILEAQWDGTILCLSPEVAFDWQVADGPERGEMGGVVFEAAFDRAGGASGDGTSVLPTLGTGRWDAPPGTPRGAVLILQSGPEEFVLAGMGAVVTFAPADGRGRVGIESARDGWYETGGAWRGGRWLNGDQTHQGRHVRLPGDTWRVQRVRLYRYT